jgi:SAM-dependent methyltransferase
MFLNDANSLPTGDYNPTVVPRLADLEAGSFWFRSRNRLIVEMLHRWFPGMRSFLEIGCGSGFVLADIARAFPGVRLAGSEMFAEGLTYARSRVPSASLFQCDARNLPVIDAFDVIGAFDVMEHITDDASVLREMFLAVRSGGGIVLTVPQHPFLWSEADRFAHHKRRYTRHDLTRKLRAAGFDVIGRTSFVSLLLPLLAVARLHRRVTRRPFNPWAEFQLPGRVDRALERVMRAELSMIRRGIVFPFGGSLIVAARKLEQSHR